MARGSASWNTSGQASLKVSSTDLADLLRGEGSQAWISGCGSDVIPGAGQGG